MYKWQTSRSLEDFQTLIDVARKYAAGEVNFTCVCVAAHAFNDAARMHVVDPRIKELAAEWASMAWKVWPGQIRAKNGIPEGEFLSWVQSQLSVFEDFDLHRQQ